MNHVNFRTTLALSIALTSFSAMANPPPPPTSIGCSKRAISANLAIQAVAYTSIDDQFQLSCPLLEEKESRKLVDKFGGGTTFAHPFIPGTCLSGAVTSGMLLLDDGTEIEIDTTASYTESSQRLFPVPSDQGDVNLFATSEDGTLQAGAAMTAVHLEGEDTNGDSYKFDLLLDDHFLLTQFGEDTEDFLIVGSSGDYKASGRLTGKGQIISQQPLGIMFEVSGTLCLK
jgi:hypothetical protein